MQHFKDGEFKKLTKFLFLKRYPYLFKIFSRKPICFHRPGLSRLRGDADAGRARRGRPRRRLAQQPRPAAALAPAGPVGAPPRCRLAAHRRPAPLPQPMPAPRGLRRRTARFRRFAQSALLSLLKNTGRFSAPRPVPGTAAEASCFFVVSAYQHSAGERSRVQDSGPGQPRGPLLGLRDAKQIKSSRSEAEAIFSAMCPVLGPQSWR